MGNVCHCEGVCQGTPAKARPELESSMISEVEEMEATFHLDASHADLGDCVLGHLLCCADSEAEHELHETTLGELDASRLTRAEVVSPVSRGPDEAGEVVALHLYDLNDTFSHVNHVAMDLLGFGAALHVGVEVLGNEWSYGMQGVSVTRPRENPNYAYRQSVPMGRTSLNRREVVGVLTALQVAWGGMQYDMFSRNCASFCNALCEQLGLGGAPAWITRLPEAVGRLPAVRRLASAMVRRCVEAELQHGGRRPFALSPTAAARLSPAGGARGSEEEEMASPVRVRLSSIPSFRSRPLQTRTEAFRDLRREAPWQPQGVAPTLLQNPFGPEIMGNCLRKDVGKRSPITAAEARRSPSRRQSYGIAGA